MSISIYLEPIAKGAELVKKLLQDEFVLNDGNVTNLYDNCVKKHFEKIQDIRPIYLQNQAMLTKFIVTVIILSILPNYLSIKETV